MHNPLLETTGPYHLPDFESVRPDHVLPALEELLQNYRDGVEQWLATGSPGGWAGVEQEVEWSDRLGRAWSVVSHLHLVTDSEELREAYNAGLQLLTEHENWRQHNDGIYRAYRELRESDEFSRLDDVQQRIVRLELRDFELEGVALPEEQREEYREINMELSRQGAAFGQNLLDARHAWTLHLDDETRLAGLPDAEKALLAGLAQRRGLEGFVIDLSYPAYHAILTHAEDRELRFQVYQAYVTCASDRGPHAETWDNASVIATILANRHRLANLLGFGNYVEYVLSRRMADTPDSVMSFLHSLADQAVPAAREQFARLAEFAQAEGATLPLEVWDVLFWAERYRKAELNLSDEELKPYFVLDHMLEAVLFTIERVFGVRLSVDPNVRAWHKDVRYFWILDADGEKVGGLFMDLYARKNKRDGAWMDGCLSRRRMPSGLQLPVAHLVCNFAPPVEGQPSLLTHHDVETLFHEIGHCMHHLLTRIDWPQVNGINNVEWDAVELPSQLFENWCWEDEIMVRFARHYQTGEQMDEDTKHRLLRSRSFQKALALVRQLEFALVDMHLHLDYDPGQPRDPQDVLNEVRAEVAVIDVPEWNRFLNGFSHIFGGGYGAGYYSYLWAEQLAADAWGAFREQGAFNPETGEKLRAEILGKGASRPALESFIAFRGRPPNPRPLLHSYGL